MPHVTIDGPLPITLENDEKRQWMTVALLHDKIKNLTEFTHVLQHRIDKEHIHRLDQEYELTILHRYVVNKEKYQDWVRSLFNKARLGLLFRSFA